MKYFIFIIIIILINITYAQDLQINLASFNQIEYSVLMTRNRGNFYYQVKKSGDINEDKIVGISFCVVIQNIGNYPIFIYSNSYSFGQEYIKLEVLLKNDKTIFLQNDSKFYRNIPLGRILYPNHTLLIPISLNEKDWKNVKKIKNKATMIRVLFIQKYILLNNDTIKKIEPKTYKSNWYNFDGEHLKEKMVIYPNLIPIKKD